MQQRRHHVVVKLRQLQQIDGRAGLGAVRLVKLDRCLAELRQSGQRQTGQMGSKSPRSDWSPSPSPSKPLASD